MVEGNGANPRQDHSHDETGHGMNRSEREGTDDQVLLSFELKKKIIVVVTFISLL